MYRRFILASLLLVSGTCSADALEIHGLSHHTQEGEFNEVNPGLGVVKDYLPWLQGTAGFYKNSYSRTTVYAGANLHWQVSKAVDVGLMVGAGTGYTNPTLVLPNIKVSYEQAYVRVGYVKYLGESLTTVNVGWEL